MTTPPIGRPTLPRPVLIGAAVGLVVLGVAVGVALRMLAGGGANPQGSADCQDAACRVDRVVAGWDADRAQRAALAGTLQTPEERLAAARVLLDRMRQADADICRILLTDPASKDWCQATMHRPHLYERPRDQATNRRRRAAGPIDTQMLPFDSAGDHGFVQELVVEEPPCGADAEPRACASQEALRLAGSGRLREAGATCRYIDPGRWRDECVFTAAEAALLRLGADAGGPATRLCAEAGAFRAHCTSHVITALAKTAPVSTETSSAAWNGVAITWRRLEREWASVDPEFGALIGARYLAEAMAWSYEGVPVVTGDPLDHLPEAAAPHVRAAAIHRMFELQESTPGDLDAWVSRAQSVLADRADARAARPRPHHVHVQDLWGLDDSVTTTIPATYWRGEARRAVSQDVDIDVVMCVLESAARARSPMVTVLQEATAHPDRQVQLTAKRLLPRTGGRAQKGPPPPHPGR